jgi:hypothetical protein
VEKRDAVAARERMYQHLFHTERWFKENLADWTGKEINHEKKQNN